METGAGTIVAPRKREEARKETPRNLSGGRCNGTLPRERVATIVWVKLTLLESI